MKELKRAIELLEEISGKLDIVIAQGEATRSIKSSPNEPVNFTREEAQDAISNVLKARKIWDSPGTVGESQCE